MNDFNQQENEHDLQTIEISMEKAKADIALGDALKNLIANPDFDLIISENYFKGEAERVIGAKADAAMIMNEVGMKMLEDQIVSIGGLRQYFLKIQHDSQTAKMAMADYRETQTELLQEAAEGAA
jgi:hypothetical protein